LEESLQREVPRHDATRRAPFKHAREVK
jgi:hypothetical protein